MRRTSVRAGLVAAVVLLAIRSLGASEDVGLREADVALPGPHIVLDAPWRVETTEKPAWLPVLLSFPETPAGWRRINVLSIAVAEVGPQGPTLIYRDTADGPPVPRTTAPGFPTGSGVTSVGMTVVDGFGRVSADPDIVRRAIDPAHPNAPWCVPVVDAASRGWHTVLRFPVAPPVAATRSPMVTLLASCEIESLEDTDRLPMTVSRRLEVVLDPHPLPAFDGWVSLDPHVHSVVEHSSDESWHSTRKAHGGPLSMLEESARAQRLIPRDAPLRGRVTVTDHNCFLSDREWIRYGPTSAGIQSGATPITRPELVPDFLDEGGRHVAQGQREYENVTNLVGPTFGEEVTLAKPAGVFRTVSGTLGSHLLTFWTRHFMGPFHGGHFFIWRDEANENTLERVLSIMAGDQRFPRGFCFAAHPFSQSVVARGFATAWTNEQVAQAASGPFVRTHADGRAEFVFKGFEVWNHRRTRAVRLGVADPDRLAALLADPTGEASWQRGDPNWDEELQHALERYHQVVSDVMRSSLPGAPATRFVRKLYLISGTDAHGDFNRESNTLGRSLQRLPGPLVRHFPIFTTSDNAFGRIRTVVDLAAPDPDVAGSPSPALAALARGRNVITDGPVLDFEMDACGSFIDEGSRFTAQPSFSDSDGRMGGEGATDGGRTMLVAEGGHDVLVRYRLATSATLGGRLERIEVYRDEAGGRARRVQIVRNTGPAWVLEAFGRLDPALTPGPDGWIVAPLGAARGLPSPGGPAQGPVRTVSAFSLAGFTRRIQSPPFDHRVYTNPVWVVPVRLTIHRTPAPGGAGPGATVNVRFQFPVSMDPRPLGCALVPLDRSGASAGRPIPLAPSGSHPSGWSDNPRVDLGKSVYAASGVLDGPLVGGGAPPGWGLYLHRPVDVRGNRLNTVAWRFSTGEGRLTPRP